MALRTPKDGYSENALNDGNRVPVQLVYDEENDAVLMMRGDEDGNLKVIGHVQLPDGETGPIGGEEQNGAIHLFVNQDQVLDKLQDLEEQLRMLNFHLGLITETNLNKEDINNA